MTPHQRLDRYMDERRLELDMDWTQLGRVAGMSYAALRNIRRGQSRPSPRTMRRLEDALGWEHGSIDVIFDGGEPRPTVAVARIDDLEQRPGESDNAYGQRLIERGLELLREKRGA